MTRRMSFVAEVEFVTDSAGTTTTRLYGTEGWATEPTDTPANTHIVGALADPGSIKSELFSGARLTGPVRPSFGQIVLSNTDGALDELMDYGMGGTVTVRYGSVGDAYPASWTTVFIAYAYALVVDFKEVRVLLRDRLFLLEKPIVTDTFAGVGGFTGTGIATKKQQMILGRPGYVPMVLVDQNLQIYFMQSNGASSKAWATGVSQDYTVFDGGVALTRGAPYVSSDEGLSTEPAAGEFRIFAEGAATDTYYESTGPVYVRLGSPPEFDIRVQPVGMIKNSVSSRARPWTFVDLLNRAGITDVTTSSLATGSTTLLAGNRLIDGDQTYLEVLADVAGARFNAFGFNRLDQFFMFDLRLGAEGSEASVHTFTIHNAKDFRRQPVPGQESPAWQVSVNAGAAWPSQIATSLTAEEADKFQRERQQSFTGTADSVRLANPGAESTTMDVVGNEFSTLDQRRAFVKRYFELFGGRRDLISLTAQLTAETIAINLHDKVTIDVPRLGCDGGRDFRVVMSELSLRARTASFWLWGGDVGPSDGVLGGGSTDTGGGSTAPGGIDTSVQMGDFTFLTAAGVSGGTVNSANTPMGDFTFITQVSVNLESLYSEMIAYWHFNENDAGSTFADELNNYPLSVRNTAGALATSAATSTLAFMDSPRSFSPGLTEGTTAYIQNSVDFEFPDGDWTFGGWFLLTNSTGGSTRFVMGNAGDLSGWQAAIALHDTNNDLLFNVSTNGTATAATVDSNFVATVGKWVFITGTLDRTNDQIVLRWRNSDAGSMSSGSAAFAGALYTGVGTANFNINDALQNDSTYLSSNRAGVMNADLCFYLGRAINDVEFDYLFNAGAGKTWAQIVADSGN